MKTPEFVGIIVGSLVLDFILLGSLFLLPPLGYHAILIMLLAIPLTVALQVPACFTWLTKQSENGSAWTSLSRMLCGSSLLFLLIVAGCIHFHNREPASWPELLGSVYLTISLIRFYGAGALNIPAALVCLLKGNKVDKLASLCAILCSGAGIALLKNVDQAQALQGQAQAIVILIFFLMSFCYGLVWGGTLTWVASRVQSPQDASKN